MGGKKRTEGEMGGKTCWGKEGQRKKGQAERRGGQGKTLLEGGVGGKGTVLQGKRGGGIDFCCAATLVVTPLPRVLLGGVQKRGDRNAEQRGGSKWGVYLE